MKKYYLAGGIAAIILAAAALLGMLAIPARLEQSTARVQYDQQSRFSYVVYAQPSYLYGPEPAIMVPDALYPIAALQTVDFTYIYQSDAEGLLTGRIEAWLENPGLWQKKLVLVNETTGQSELRMSFEVDPTALNSLFNQIEMETGVAEGSRNVTLKAFITDGGVSRTQDLPLILNSSMLQISSILAEAFEGGSGYFGYSLERRSDPETADNPASARYPAELVESLDLTYSYQPESEAAGTLSLAAVLENPNIWQKSLELVNDAGFSGRRTVSCSLDMATVWENFEEIEKETGLQAEVRMITLRATLVQGEKTTTQDLPISLVDNVMVISGDLESRLEGGSGTFDYILNLKPNSLYASSRLSAPTATPAEDSVAGESGAADYELYPPVEAVVPAQSRTALATGQTIFTRLIDSMDLTFNYQFKSDQPVSNLRTKAQFYAILQLPGEWSRTITLLETEREGDFSLTIPVDLVDYASLQSAISAETGVSAASYNISIIASLHTTGETDYGPIDEVFTPALTGTVAEGVLQWSNQLTAGQSGSLDTTETVPNNRSYLGLPGGAARYFLLAIALVLLAAGAVAFYGFSRSAPLILASGEKQRLAINKKYGIRLAEALEYPADAEEKTIPLKSMEDLIKVADELAKPVIYRGPQTGRASALYCVVDGWTRYQYELKLEEPAEEPEFPAPGPAD